MLTGYRAAVEDVLQHVLYCIPHMFQHGTKCGKACTGVGSVLSKTWSTVVHPYIHNSCAHARGNRKHVGYIH